MRGMRSDAKHSTQTLPLPPLKDLSFCASLAAYPTCLLIQLELQDASSSYSYSRPCAARAEWRQPRNPNERRSGGHSRRKLADSPTPDLDQDRR